MLLHEAALRAGVASQATLLARPTCMALPAALAGGMAASTGCIGNRVYTGIADSEFYVAMAGMHVERIAREVETILAANTSLREYHNDRRLALANE